MKIKKIQTLIFHARMRNWVFVKVVTDQPGLIGWGEATLEWHTRGVVGAIEDIAELLVGEDPTRPVIRQMMHRQHFGMPRHCGATARELTGVWDIAARRRQPLVRSSRRTGAVRSAPCHLGGGDGRFYQTPVTTRASPISRAGQTVSRQKHGSAHDADRRVVPVAPLKPVWR
jgi:galactonate dehydratase